MGQNISEAFRPSSNRGRIFLADFLSVLEIIRLRAYIASSDSPVIGGVIGEEITRVVHFTSDFPKRWSTTIH